MKLLPSLSRRAYILSGTLFAFLLIFSFYFFIYLPNREENIISHRYRALEQSGLNFREKWKASEKVAEKLSNRYKRLKLHADSLSRQKHELDSILQVVAAKEAPAVVQDSITAAVKEAEILLKAANIRLEDLQADHFLNISFAEPDAPGEVVLYRSPSEKDTAATDSQIYVSANLALFFSSLKREDIFEEYFLFKEGAPSLLYQSREGELYLSHQENTLADQKNSQSPADSVTNASINRGISMGEIREVKLGNTPYKLFTTKVATANAEWIIYGLVSRDTFEAEKRSIPSIIVVTYTILLLLVLFAMPLIKLAFMSTIERLHQHNVIQSAVSFILSFSLLVVCIISMDSYLVSNSSRVHNNLEIISENINLNLEEELNTLTALLDSLDQEEPKELNYSVSIYDGDSTRLSARTRKLLAAYPNFDYIYWMDERGRVVHELAALETNTIKVDRAEEYGKRAYFSEIQHNRGWARESGVADPKKFYLESIFSWYAGKNSAVFSRNSSWHQAKVVGISSELNSVFNVILPPGYQFQIVDREGRVLFHSIKNRNLQENYLKECDDNSGLFSAIQSNTSAHTSITYYNQQQKAFVQPLRGLPWYIITSYNKQYSDLAYTQIIIFTIGSVVLLGLVLGFLTLVSSLVYYRKSKLNNNIFYLDWLRPRRERSREYLLILALNIVFLIVLLAYNSLAETSALQSLTGFGFTLIVQFAFAFAVLQQREQNYYVFLGCTLLILVFLVLGLHRLSGMAPTDKSFFSLISATAVAGFLLYFRKPVLPVSKYMARVFGKMMGADFKKVYVLMLFTFLLLSGLLSPLVLFMKYYKEEMLVWEKAALYKLSQDLEEKERHIDEKYAFLGSNKISREQAGDVVNKCKQEGSLFRLLGYGYIGRDSIRGLSQCQQAALLSTRTRPLHHKPKLAYALTSQLRPQISRLIIQNNGFVYPESRDYKWLSQELDTVGSSRVLMGSVDSQAAAAPVTGLLFTYSRTPHLNDRSILTAGMPYYLKHHLDGIRLGSLFFMLMLAGIVIAAYVGLRIAIKDFFNWGLVKKKAILRIDDACLGNVALMQSQNLFIVSLPFSDFKSFKPDNTVTISNIFSLSQLYKEEEFKEIYARLQHIREEKVVLDHFGYNPKDIAVSNRKLELLERLLLNRNQVIIVSGIRPIQIIELYDKELESMAKLSQEEKSKLDFNQYTSNLNRWRDILSGFVKIFPSPATFRQQAPRTTVEQLIAYECSASGYFRRISTFFESLPADVRKSTDRRVKEEVILKIQSMAQPYYFSIWNTCSKEEKYVLYDLAKDDFVNTKNINCVLMLMDKGLIHQDENEQLHVMNESFRNFILTNIKQSEALEMEKELLQSGTYSIFKAVMVVVAVSTLLFISFAERAILDSFLAVLAALTALLPLLFRLGGWFISPTAANKA